MNTQSHRPGSAFKATPASAYAVAVVAVLVAAGIRWSLVPVLGLQHPFTIFFAAVVCAAWYGGVGPGTLAVILSYFLAQFIFVEPVYSLSVNRVGLITGLTFAVVAMSCVMLSGSLHRTRARAVLAERQLRDVLGSMADDFLAVDRSWRITFINAHASATLGRPHAHIRDGSVLWDAFPGIKGSELEQGCRVAMAERRVIRIESSGPFAGRWLDLSIYPTENGIAIYGRDVSRLLHAEERSRFLADASRVLGQTLDFDQTLRQVADLAVPRLADWCFVDLVESDGSFRKVAIQGASTEKAGIGEELLRRYPPDRTRPHPIQQAHRTLQPELVTRVTDSWIQSRARDERHLELLRALNFRSLMAIPLIARKQLLGVITLASAESGREYTQVDLENAEALAVHIALAISNSRLYQEAQMELHERTVVERALRDSEGRFRTLVTATGAMVWRVAPDGRAIDEPSGWEEITGQPYAELAEDPAGWFSRVHPADIGRVQSLWGQAQAAKRMIDVEFRLLRRDGMYRRMHTVGVPLLNDAGTILEWIGTTIDIHDRREAEEQLQQAQRMETVGRLAGGMAHETNNQMLVVLSFIEFLLEGTNLTDEQRRDLQAMADAAERVAALTRQLLALGRRQLLDTRVLDLDTVVMQAESVLRRTLGPQIRFSVQFESGSKWVMADRNQLVQILVNLALNARDAIGGSGELTISTRRSDRGPANGRLRALWGHRGVALLSVADTGSGIEPSTLGRIFEPFFSTKPAGQGTGLGLSVVEGIVSQSGGDIWVESKPGYGTVVTIGLPVTEEPQVEEPAVPSLLNGLHGSETVLVVDDEEQVRRLLVRGLEQRDYRVMEASGGQEAIAILEQEAGQVQIVVTDIAMPVMSGIELAERISEHWPALPVVFVSGHPYEVVAHEQGKIAVDRFLQKPFKVDTMLALVRNALDRE